MHSVRQLLGWLSCALWIHRRTKFIKAKDYDPPQLFVAGCYVCERCSAGFDNHQTELSAP